MHFESLGNEQFLVRNVGKINIIVGKNGSGKSRGLKQLEAYLQGEESIEKAEYVTPERAGTLEYEPSEEQQAASNKHYVRNTRYRNQYGRFRQQSYVHFRQLISRALRNFEKAVMEQSTKCSSKCIPPDELQALSSARVVNSINSLLDNIRIQETDTGFEIYEIENRDNREEDPRQISSEEISSGEAELISLAIECLRFRENIETDKPCFLLLDEPDVHLHPDLQHRLGEFIARICEEIPNLSVFIATHSTAFLQAIEKNKAARIGFVSAGEKIIHFENISEVLRRVIPVFGAHPLSNLFMDRPIMLVEGGDEERIWNQAMRTSGGLFRLFPCEVGGKANLVKYEQSLRSILVAVYDNPIAFSLRDRDDEDEAIEDIEPVVRAKLSCRASENLLLCDESLTQAGVDWFSIQTGVEKWLSENQNHKHFQDMKDFKEGGYNRKHANLKNIRVDLLGIMESTSPWEEIIGKAIGKALTGKLPLSGTENGLVAYLGGKVWEKFVLWPT